MKRVYLSLLTMAVGLGLTAIVAAPLSSPVGETNAMSARNSSIEAPSGAVGGACSGYLFAYFEGGGDTNLMEQLRFAVSEDAQNWYALNGNRPIIASDSISESGGIRDPHILRGEDGCYYIVATDMHVFDPKQGWGLHRGPVDA